MLHRTEALAVGGALTFAVQCVPPVKMPRKRGLSVPKPKKKKSEQHEEVGPSETEPAPAAAMPPPPPGSPEPARRPTLPASPGLKARKEANVVLKEALLTQKAASKRLRRADALLGQVYLLRDEMSDKIEKALKNKAQAKKNALKIQTMYHKAELQSKPGIKKTHH